jgi:hypothetical protein
MLESDSVKARNFWCMSADQLWLISYKIEHNQQEQFAVDFLSYMMRESNRMEDYYLISWNRTTIALLDGITSWTERELGHAHNNISVIVYILS